MDTAVRRELKKVFHKFPTSENLEAFGKHGSFFRSGFFYEHFNRQFTEVVFFFVKRFYANILSFVQLGTASPLRTFWMSLHSTKRKT